MSDVRNAAAVVKDIAEKAFDAKSGQLIAEQIEPLRKANEALDKEIAGLKAAIAAKSADARFGAGKANKTAADENYRLFMKTGRTSQFETKADGYVRFEAANAGNLLLQPEMAAEINRQILEFSPVLDVVDVQNISGPALAVPVQDSYVAAYWEGEDQPTDLGKDTFDKVTITPFRLASRVWFSQEMLDDSAYDLEGYTNQSIVERFAQKIGNSVLAGNGVKKPQGMIDNVSSSSTTSLTLSFNQIIALMGAIKPGYLVNDGKTGWMMNPATKALVRSLAISSTAVQYAWNIDGTTDYPERLLGYPVFTAAAADMASPSAAGAYTTGQKPILFGNFRKAYTVAQRPELYVIRDIYSGSSQFRVFLNVMKRLDGRVTQAEAVYALNMTT